MTIDKNISNDINYTYMIMRINAILFFYDKRTLSDFIDSFKLFNEKIFNLSLEHGAVNCQIDFQTNLLKVVEYGNEYKYFEILDTELLNIYDVYIYNNAYSFLIKSFVGENDEKFDFIISEKIKYDKLFSEYVIKITNALNIQISDLKPTKNGIFIKKV